MSDLTVVLFTIGLALLSSGLVLRWQDWRAGGRATDTRITDD